MSRYFLSDNAATVSVEILDAIREANSGPVKSYGDDPWTQRLDSVFGEFFGTEVTVFPLATGTAANALSLATVVPPYGAIFAHEEAHILRDECGAPEFYSGGARIVVVDGAEGRMSRDALQAAVEAWPASVHTYQPAAVAMTQATELGTVYSPDDIASIASFAHSRKLVVQMDGARFANAVVSLNASPADLSWRAGVDMLSFGATKNGALAAEAVVFFQRDLARDFELRRKRGGHLLSKLRYVSAQLLAYLETGLWQRNAQRANESAARIGGAAARFLLYPVQANEIFVSLGEAHKQTLRSAGFQFYDWGSAQSGAARFVTSWDQDEADVAALCAALLKL